MLETLARLRASAPQIAAFARDARDAARLATDLLDRVAGLAERLDGAAPRDVKPENVIPLHQDARGVWTATRSR